MGSNNSVISGIFWKLLERFGVAGIQFILQIILARLLSPEHYGALALMVVFTTLATVFVQSGFNTALIQNKDVTEEDYSSVFWVSLGVAGVLYAALFLAAPLIAMLYDMPDIVQPFRVLALMLFPGALNSIQLAKVSRELDFRKVFFSNIGGIIISGIVGITLAYMGGGLWVLVVQALLKMLVVCLVMRFTVNWRIRFVCNFSRVKTLFSFGWKLLASALLDTLYRDLHSLIVGLKYDSGTLGYYNRGMQFPQFIINAVNGAVQSVMLPAMSARQEDRAQVKALMRKSIMVSAYLIFPMMAGLAAVATPVVSLLLTDKWLPCVPFLQIYCFTFSFYPVHTSNLQAINAVGRSDIFLKLEIIKKILGVSVLVIAVVYFETPMAIAMTGALTTLISSFINAYPNKELIGYSYFEQMKDIAPSFLMSLVMCAVVFGVGTVELSMLLTLLLQIVTGVLVYLLLSLIVRPLPFVLLLERLKNLLVKKTLPDE